MPKKYTDAEIEAEMHHRWLMLAYANAHVIDTVAYLNCDDLRAENDAKETA